MWCNMIGEAAGEHWNWSILGVKAAKQLWVNSSVLLPNYTSSSWAFWRCTFHSICETKRDSKWILNGCVIDPEWLLYFHFDSKRLLLTLSSPCDLFRIIEAGSIRQLTNWRGKKCPVLLVEWWSVTSHWVSNSAQEETVSVKWPGQNQTFRTLELYYPSVSRTTREMFKTENAQNVGMTRSSYDVQQKERVGREGEQNQLTSCHLFCLRSCRTKKNKRTNCVPSHNRALTTENTKKKKPY